MTRRWQPTPTSWCERSSPRSANGSSPVSAGCCAHSSARSEAETVTLIGAARVDATREVIAELRAVLALDVDEQRQNPLSILRGAVRYPTRVFRAVGAQPVARDEFDERSFPDDEFALTPAAFADFGPAVHEAGIMWGAAKAHVHLQRRRGPKP